MVNSLYFLILARQLMLVNLPIGEHILLELFVCLFLLNHLIFTAHLIKSQKCVLFALQEEAEGKHRLPLQD